LVVSAHSVGDVPHATQLLTLVRVARKLPSAEEEETEEEDAATNEKAGMPLLQDAGQTSGYFERHAESPQSEEEETEKVPATAASQKFPLQHTHLNDCAVALSSSTDINRQTSIAARILPGIVSSFVESSVDIQRCCGFYLVEV
jgi:hypothetical protein